MSDPKRVLLVSAALLACFSVALLAVPEDFLISRKVKDQNVEPAVAYNSQSGDAVVVWTSRTEDYSQGIIYAARISYNGTKTKVYKPKAISSKAAGDLNQQPAIAYNTSSNTYFVVWSINHQVSGFYRTDLYMRELNAKGKPKGSIIKLVADDNYGNSTPKILPHYLYEEPIDFDPDPELIIVWDSAFYGGGSTRSGLVAAIVDDKGNYSVGRTLLVASHQYPDSSIGSVTPDDFIQSGLDGSYFVTCRKYGPKPPSAEAPANDPLHGAVVQIKNNGSLKGVKAVLSSNDLASSRICQIANKKFLSTWYDSVNYEVNNQIIKSKPRTAKKPFDAIDGAQSFGTDFFALETGGCLQFNNLFGILIYQRYNSRGKPVGDFQIPKVGIYSGLEVEMIGREPLAVLVLSTNDLDFDNSEIRGLVLPLDDLVE